MPRKNAKKTSKAIVSTSRSGVAREFALASSVLRKFVKRICSSTYLQANGSGLIPATTLASTNGVSVTGDFSAVAGIYSNYRVKAIRFHAKPFHKVNTTSVTVSPLIAVIPFRSGLVPTTFPAFIESSEVKFGSGYESFSISTSNDGYPDGKLWHPTNAVISAADSFGFACMGQNYTGNSASAFVWMTVVEYLVEFSVEN